MIAAISSFVMIRGYLEKGKTVMNARARSLMVRASLSISGTCSLAEVVFSIMPQASSLSNRHEYASSPKMYLTANP